MSQEQYEAEAAAIAQQLPAGPRVVVIGSASFWGNDSSELCDAVGSQLATLKSLVLLTGGVSGVGEAVGRSFFRARQDSATSPNTYHVLPRGFDAWDYGITLFGGSSMAERREILGRLARVYISIEGGPGTAHEAVVAQSKGAVIVPLGRTGGFSGDTYPASPCPAPQLTPEWQVLNDMDASIERVGRDVRHIVQVITDQGV